MYSTLKKEQERDKKRGKRLENLQEYGFTKDQAIKVKVGFPNLLGCTAERTNGLLKNLQEYGFTKNQLIKMAASLTSLLSYTAERTNGLLKNLQKYGFTKNQVIKMAAVFPSLLSYTAERTNGLLKNLQEYGFTKNQVIKMEVKLPSLLGYTAERTGKHIEWLRHHKIEVDLVEKPFYLITSVKTLETRRKMLKRIGFDYTRYPNPLFCGKKRWQGIFDKLSSQTISSSFKPIT